MVMGAVTKSVEFVALIMYTVLGLGAVGVPVISPVVGLIVSPAGRLAAEKVMSVPVILGLIPVIGIPCVKSLGEEYPNPLGGGITTRILVV
jgi:hypothetical protein